MVGVVIIAALCVAGVVFLITFFVALERERKALPSNPIVWIYEPNTAREISLYSLQANTRESEKESQPLPGTAFIPEPRDGPRHLRATGSR